MNIDSSTCSAVLLLNVRAFRFFVVARNATLLCSFRCSKWKGHFRSLVKDACIDIWTNMHIYMKKCTHTHTCIYVCVSYTYIYICINILNLVAQHVKEKNKKEQLIEDSALTFIISFSNYREKKIHGDETWSAKEAILETSVCGNAVSCGWPAGYHTSDLWPARFFLVSPGLRAICAPLFSQGLERKYSIVPHNKYTTKL